MPHKRLPLPRWGCRRSKGERRIFGRGSWKLGEREREKDGRNSPVARAQQEQDKDRIWPLYNLEKPRILCFSLSLSLPFRNLGKSSHLLFSPTHLSLFPLFPSALVPPPGCNNGPTADRLCNEVSRKEWKIEWREGKGRRRKRRRKGGEGEGNGPSIINGYKTNCKSRDGKGKGAERGEKGGRE